ncbi:MAG TPA: class I SAM-dependent methyltransferase [Bryobacteraceae bacterium]|nr:class I SAM-dependent methyltransferase [Bryobacteraceae bacterium]
MPTIDFGYPWWLTYGHLPIVVCAAALFLLGYIRKWSKWPMLLWGFLLLWSSASLFITRFVFDINGRPALPTESFLRSGSGRVLDLGAGTGRSSIMVLAARPQTTLVALDLFGSSFEQHFGPSASPQDKLMANLKAAGVDQRASIQTGDMRKLPFEPSSFDAIVSAYAIDHLGRDGIRQTLAEAARVVKPGGDFLLMITAKEPWVGFAFGPLLVHQRNLGPDWWNAQLQEAGFKVIEEGTRPATLYVLSRRS